MCLVDLLIGVHCTHGINRTGYLIARYLIDQCDWSSHAALDGEHLPYPRRLISMFAAFEKARGYPIERGNYVQSLHAAAKDRKLAKKCGASRFSRPELNIIDTSMPQAQAVLPSALRRRPLGRRRGWRRLLETVEAQPARAEDHAQARHIDGAQCERDAAGDVKGVLIVKLALPGTG